MVTWKPAEFGKSGAVEPVTLCELPVKAGQPVGVFPLQPVPL